MNSIYPWQTTQWQFLLKQHQDNRLPHALLLVGTKGLGKTDFARHFANYLLCLQPQQNTACGVCKSCELNNADTHPDLILITPEEEGKQIKIADIRDANESVAQTAQQGGYRIIIVSPAEAMNVSSANALLKMLEEPGKQTIFLLVSHVQGRMPATVRSRCQKIVFTEPDVSVALEWLSNAVADQSQAETLLDLAHGAPLEARALFESDALEQYTQMCSSLIAVGNNKTGIVEVAKLWSDWDVPMLFGWLIQLFAAMIKHGLSDAFTIKNKELTVIHQQVSTISPRALCGFLDKISSARQLSLSTANLNKQLLIEDLLVSWIELLKR